MSNGETDAIAREAARLVALDGLDIRRAIGAAAEALRADAPRPTPGRVRQHLQAMSMQALGEAGYRRGVRAVLEAVEAVMTLIEESFDDVATRVAGRAARGQMDGPSPVHIRLYTRRPVGEIAGLLEAHGYAEAAFETARTRHGPLDRIRLTDEEGELVLTRCPPELLKTADRSLFDDRPVPTLDLAGLRRQLETPKR